VAKSMQLYSILQLLSLSLTFDIITICAGSVGIEGQERLVNRWALFNRLWHHVTGGERLAPMSAFRGHRRFVSELHDVTATPGARPYERFANAQRPAFQKRPLSPEHKFLPDAHSTPAAGPKLQVQESVPNISAPQSTIKNVQLRLQVPKAKVLRRGSGTLQSPWPVTSLTGPLVAALALQPLSQLQPSLSPAPLPMMMPLSAPSPSQQQVIPVPFPFPASTPGTMTATSTLAPLPVVPQTEAATSQSGVSKAAATAAAPRQCDCNCTPPITQAGQSAPAVVPSSKETQPQMPAPASSAINATSASAPAPGIAGPQFSAPASIPNTHAQSQHAAPAPGSIASSIFGPATNTSAWQGAMDQRPQPPFPVPQSPAPAPVPPGLAPFPAPIAAAFAPSLPAAGFVPAPAPDTMAAAAAAAAAAAMGFGTAPLPAPGPAPLQLPMAPPAPAPAATTSYVPTIIEAAYWAPMLHADLHSLAASHSPSPASGVPGPSPFATTSSCGAELPSGQPSALGTPAAFCIHCRRCCRCNPASQIDTCEETMVPVGSATVFCGTCERDCSSCPDLAYTPSMPAMLAGGAESLFCPGGDCCEISPPHWIP